MRIGYGNESRIVTRCAKFDRTSKDELRNLPTGRQAGIGPVTELFL